MAVEVRALRGRGLRGAVGRLGRDDWMDVLQWLQWALSHDGCFVPMLVHPASDTSSKCFRMQDALIQSRQRLQSIHVAPSPKSPCHLTRSWKPMWQDQLSNSLISSIDCVLFSSSLIMPSELALHFMFSDIVATLVGQLARLT